MAEVTNELIYKLMLDIQAEQKTMRAHIDAGFADIRAEQEALSAKVGTIADSMVSMRKQMDDQTTSTRLIAVAVDEHSHRLERIEKKLDLAHV